MLAWLGGGRQRFSFKECCEIFPDGLTNLSLQSELESGDAGPIICFEGSVGSVESNRDGTVEVSCFGTKVFGWRKFIEPLAFTGTCDHNTEDGDDISLLQGNSSKAVWRRCCNRAFFLAGWNVIERTTTSSLCEAQLTTSEYVWVGGAMVWPSYHAINKLIVGHRS